MIIFRGDAEFGVEIVKFALRRQKSQALTSLSQLLQAFTSFYQLLPAFTSFYQLLPAFTPEIHAVGLSGAVVGIYHDHFSRRC